MAKQVKSKKDGDNIPRRKKSSLKIRERVRKHIKDIHDVITDDDIRNAEIDLGEVKKEVKQKKKELEENAKVNEGSLKEGGKKITTPWDVIDE